MTVFVDKVSKFQVNAYFKLFFELQAYKSFSFATGGAGFCISLGLAIKMIPMMKYEIEFFFINIFKL